MTIGTKIGSGLGLTLAILAAIGLISYSCTAKLVEANRTVAHTHEVLANLEALVSILKDAETGQRGYIITEDERYLEPYDAAVKNREPIIRKLRDLTIDNSSQQERLTA